MGSIPAGRSLRPGALPGGLCEVAAMIRAFLALTWAVMTAVVLVTPAADPPETDPAAAVDPPAVAVCPVEEGSGRSTTVGIASRTNGEGGFTAFLGGGPVGPIP